MVLLSITLLLCCAVLLLRIVAADHPWQSRRAFVQQLKLQGGCSIQYKAALAHAAHDMPSLGRLVLQCDRWVKLWAAAALGCSTHAACRKRFELLLLAS
jgi:hypothetical protein